MANDSPHVRVDERFAIIPEALLYDADVPAEAVRVYGVLVRHGSDPSNCYPSHARIAERIGKSARSVPAWIRALEDAGWVDRVPRWRRGDEVATSRPDGDGWEPTSNGYVVRAVQRGVRAEERGPLPAEEQPPSALGRAPKDSHENDTQEENARAGSLFSDDEVPREPDPPIILNDALESQFAEFWKAYPLKVGKGAARKAWPAAVRKARDWQRIVAGAERYRADPNRSPQFTAHPSTWLNGERWDDDPLPVRGGQPQRRPVDQDRGGVSGRVAL